MTKKNLIGVIDGHVDTVTNISNFLEAKGFKTAWAYTEKTGKELAKRDDVEIIVMDTFLLKDGKAEEVKKIIDGKKVILISGKMDNSKLIKGIKVIGILPKPVDLEELEKVLKKEIN